MGRTCEVEDQLDRVVRDQGDDVVRSRTYSCYDSNSLGACQFSVVWYVEERG